MTCLPRDRQVTDGMKLPNWTREDMRGAMTSDSAARPLAGVFVLAFGLVGFWQAAAIPVSPLYAQVGHKAIPYVVASGMTVLGAGLVLAALRGGWSASVADVVEAGPPNMRALGTLGAGLLANLVLIGPAGFSIAASAQFVLVAASHQAGL